MKIKAGDNIIELPERIEPSTADLMVYSGGFQQQNPDGYWIIMSRVSLEEIMQRDMERTGIPAIFAIALLNEAILIWPRNGSDREIQIQYCPAMKVI